MKEIPLHQYCTFIKAELAAAMDKATFKGMRDSGPNKANEEELERFLVKRRQWAFLVSNIGLYSGQFARLVANGSSCQDEPRAHISCPGEKQQPEKAEAQQEQQEQEAQQEQQEQEVQLLSTTSQRDKRSRKRKRNRKKCRKGKSWPQAQKAWT